MEPVEIQSLASESYEHNTSRCLSLLREASHEEAISIARNILLGYIRKERELYQDFLGEDITEQIIDLVETFTNKFGAEKGESVVGLAIEEYGKEEEWAFCDAIENKYNTEGINLFKYQVRGRAIGGSAPDDLFDIFKESAIFGRNQESQIENYAFMLEGYASIKDRKFFTEAVRTMENNLGGKEKANILRLINEKKILENEFLEDVLQDEDCAISLIKNAELCQSFMKKLISSIPEESRAVIKYVVDSYKTSRIVELTLLEENARSILEFTPDRAFIPREMGPKIAEKIYTELDNTAKEVGLENTVLSKIDILNRLNKDVVNVIGSPEENQVSPVSRKRAASDELGPSTSPQNPSAKRLKVAEKDLDAGRS